MSEYRPKEGTFNLGSVRIAVITARWNAQVTDGLRDGALRALTKNSITAESIEDFAVPGAFEN